MTMFSDQVNLAKQKKSFWTFANHTGGFSSPQARPPLIFFTFTLGILFSFSPALKVTDCWWGHSDWKRFFASPWCCESITLWVTSLVIVSMHDFIYLLSCLVFSASRRLIPATSDSPYLKSIRRYHTFHIILGSPTSISNKYCVIDINSVVIIRTEKLPGSKNILPGAKNIIWG